MLESSLGAPVCRSGFQLFLHNGFDMFAAKRVADELLGLSRLGMVLFPSLSRLIRIQKVLSTLATWCPVTFGQALQPSG